MISSKLSLSDWFLIVTAASTVFVGGYRIGAAEEAISKIVDRIDRVEQRINQNDNTDSNQVIKLDYLQKQQEKTNEVTEKMMETLNNLNVSINKLQAVIENK